MLHSNRYSARLETTAVEFAVEYLALGPMAVVDSCPCSRGLYRRVCLCKLEKLSVSTLGVVRFLFEINIQGPIILARDGN